jgi:hypothetical protein
MDQTFKNWLWQKKAEKCVEALKKHDFDACFVRDTAEAKELVLEMIKDYEIFGFGGSSTTRQLGIIEELQAMGKAIWDHWQDGLPMEDSRKIRMEQGRCDCFLCSANAISETGEIINVDGAGNRTNAMSFGPKKVVIVAGMNKVRADLHAALGRIKEVAGPMRAKSLNMDTPCAKTGICNDCNVPQRICRITTILHRKPIMTDISVVLVNQSLGF